MKKVRILFVLAVLFLLLLLPGEAKALGLDTVRVTVLTDESGKPVAAENVRLHLYRYDSSALQKQTTITDFNAGSCTTGADGRCEVWILPGMPKDAAGFYRGALEVRGRLRSILWPGGLFEIHLNLSELLQPVEFGEDDAATTETIVVQHQEAVNWFGILAPVALIGLVVAVIWWKSRKNRRVLLGLLFALALSAFLATPAWAADPQNTGDPDYCSGTGGVAIDLTRCYSTSELLEYLMRWGITELGTGAARSFDSALWLIDRLCAGFFDLTVNSPILVEIKDAFLKVVTTLMPDVLRQVVMGPTGLFYVAVALSGVLMTIPLWSGGSKLVRPERAIAWGVLLIALFISGSGLGYDLVNGIETLRSDMIKQVMSGTVDAKAVVTGPMGASDVSIGADTSWALPKSFEAKYFPAPTRQVVTVYLFEPGTPIFGGSSGNTEVETDESMQTRQLAAGQSLIWALISIVGAVMLLLAAMTFAFLAVAAMMLILFLFAALPLGFFEFGNGILTAIIGKYLNVVMLSLAMAIFMRWVTAGISLIGDPSDIQGAIHYLVILMIMIYALSVISGSAFRLLTDSGQVFGQSMQAVFSGGGVNLLGAGVGALTNGLGGGMPLGQGGGAGVQQESPSLASSVVGGALSGIGFHAVSSMFQDQQAVVPKRGDVFRDDAGTGFQPAAVTSPISTTEKDNKKKTRQNYQDRDQQDQQGAQPPDDQPTRLSLFDQTPSPAEAEATLQTLAGREGWQDQQLQMIRNVARRPVAENIAVKNLAAAPGFERSTDETIQQALRAAQTLGPDTRPAMPENKERA